MRIKKRCQEVLLSSLTSWCKPLCKDSNLLDSQLGRQELYH
jgi:hypothetical protein